MSHNTFGHLFRVTTWGESHGPALGCVVDGCPPGIPLTEADIQVWLDKRRPGAGKFVTQRQEPDAVSILSGVFEDERTGGQVTTGTPISMMIENVDQRSRDYSEIATSFRPGHADYAYFAKYGVRDYRGGGRQSARETAARVAAGAIARKVLGEGVTMRAALVQIGPHAIDRARWDWDEVARQSLLVPGRRPWSRVWEEHLETIRKAGSSTGAIVEVEAAGRPGRLGRADLWQARRRDRRGADVDQRRQGRRDRRGLRRRGAVRRGERRRDARWATTAPVVPLQQRRRRPGRHLHRPAGGRRGWRSSRPRRS